MLSKKEIEKAKEDIKNSYVISTKHCLDDDNKQLKQVIETLLQYIKELEADNYELNNRLNEYIEDNKKLNKIIDEMAKYINNPYQLYVYKNKMSEIVAIKKHFEKKVEEENQELKQIILGMLKGEN